MIKYNVYYINIYPMIMMMQEQEYADPCDGTKPLSAVPQLTAQTTYWCQLYDAYIRLPNAKLDNHVNQRVTWTKISSKINCTDDAYTAHECALTCTWNMMQNLMKCDRRCYYSYWTPCHGRVTSSILRLSITDLRVMAVQINSWTASNLTY